MLKKGLIFLVVAYKKHISPLMHSACRFHPSCSGYAVLAIEKYGAGKGSWLSILRILRCNRYFKGGLDPVL